MSDTPRTDAEAVDFSELVRKYTNAAMPTQVIVDGLKLVLVDFARGLERENAELKKEISLLRIMQKI